MLECADHVEQGFMEQLEAEQAEAEDELKKAGDLVKHPQTMAFLKLNFKVADHVAGFMLQELIQKKFAFLKTLQAVKHRLKLPCLRWLRLVLTSSVWYRDSDPTLLMSRRTLQ